MSPDPALDAALAARLRDLAHGPAPLLVASDLDGTLAPIVARPEEARVPAATLAVLGALAGATPTAIVTGRDLATARAMAPVAGLDYVASHGLEASFVGDIPAGGAAALDALATLTAAVEASFAGTALQVERKARSTAFHYRADAALGARLDAALADLPAGLRLQRGRFVVEVLPEAAGKDAALRALVAHVRPRSLLALGDDLTDVAMFEAARALRAEGARALILAVAGGPETPPEVLAAADAVIAQEQVEAALAALARALDAPPPP